MTYGRELLKGSTDTLLLSMVSYQPMYGYQIIKELEKRSKGYFQFKEGTLYPALHRLEKSGLLKGNWEKLSGGQERRYYSLTARGQEVLDERLDEWRNFAAAIDSIMLPASL